MSAPSPSSPATKPSAASATTTSKKKPQKHGPKSIAQVAAGSVEARRTAAAVLEVLAGTRTTVDAAQALSVSLPRYYALEARAIEGLVKGCEARRPGRRAGPEVEVAKLKKEVARLEREHSRNLALARTAQRAIGLAPPPAKPQAQPGRKKRKKPVARALVAAALLRAEPPAPASDAPAMK